MIKENVYYKIKCDMPNCRNESKINLKKNIDDEIGFKLCEKCEKEIYEILSKEFIPKAIINPLSNKFTNKKNGSALKE